MKAHSLYIFLELYFEARNLVSGYLTLLRSKKFLASAFGLCFSVAPYFVLIGILPLLFMEALGVSINEYAFYQGSIVGFFSALSLGFPYVLSRFNIAQVVRLSSILAMAIGTALAGIFYDGSFMPIAFIMFVSIAVTLPMSWFVMKKRATSTSSNEAFAVIH